MQEKYTAAWEKFGKNSNRSINNKNFLGLNNEKIMEVNQSCELGESHFLNNRSNNKTMIVDEQEESDLSSSVGFFQDAITEQSCCVIQDSDQQDDLISIYSSIKTKNTNSKITKKSQDIKQNQLIKQKQKNIHRLLYNTASIQSQISSVASSSQSSSSSSSCRIGVKKINSSKQNFGIKNLLKIKTQSSSSANNTTAHTIGCNNTTITNSTTNSGVTTPINMCQIVTPNQKGYKKVVTSNVKKIQIQKNNKSSIKYAKATPLVQINLQLHQQEEKKQTGGVTPLTGTWKDRDASMLVTTQKKVIYSGQEQLDDYKQEVDKLKDHENRFEFIQQEKKNIRFNNTTQTNLFVKKSQEQSDDHRRIGRNLFKASSCQKGKNICDNKSQVTYHQKGGESPSTVQFAAFKQKQHKCQKNMSNCLNQIEEKEFFKRAQTQISKYDKKFLDYSPYKPQIFAQKQFLRRKLQSNKDYQKLLFNKEEKKFFPIQCTSLVTKKVPIPDSFCVKKDFYSSKTTSKKSAINFDQFDKSYPKHIEKISRQQSNQKINDTSSPPFQTLFQSSMTSRNQNQNYLKTEFSPECNSTTNNPRFNNSFFKGTLQQLCKNTPQLTSNNKKMGRRMILSPNNIQPASQTPQIESFSAKFTNLQRQNITTPKASIGGMKHSMSSMNTPTSRFINRAALSSGKVLFNKFSGQMKQRGQIRDSQHKIIQYTNARVYRPVAAINTKLPKSSIQSLESQNQCKSSGKACIQYNNNFQLNKKGGAFCTLGASVGSKPNSNSRSAFKSQASRKLHFTCQQNGSLGSNRDLQSMKSKAMYKNGQNISVNLNSESSKKPRKMISEYAKTPFDKASALKREKEFNDSSSGRKMSGIQSVAALGGIYANNYKKFIGHNDEVKKQLVFDIQSSIGSGMR